MKLPLSWLKDYTDIGEVTPKEYADAMTMSGSKVEGVTELGAEIQNVVVGKITKKEKHPNADTLWVCQVDVGGESVQIVTGAQNINEGDLIPAALSGAKLPGGKAIKAGKLRGEVSAGMMCSHEELGLSKEDIEGAADDGIIILRQGYAPGTNIKEVLGLNDYVAEFEITSNRPDCLSVIGLARESAATFSRPFNLKTPQILNETGDIGGYIKVEVRDAELCPRYAARAVKNVSIRRSPKWLRDRLEGAGVRSINNIVDITNYVMLEYGQPMHAFDRDFLKAGQILVRRANEGEKIVTLDGVQRTLTPSMLVITDGSCPVAIAGVMGGENSEIVDSTKDIIFESAVFDGASVRAAAQALGMRTESSSRFEKGLDAENCLAAVNRACELVELLDAGEVVKGCVDIYGAKKQKRTLPVEPDRINAFLGTQISGADMLAALEGLGFVVNNDMTVTVPSFREDVESFADIAEEVARIYGYDKIESTLMKSEVTIGARTFEQGARERISDFLADTGYYETVTYSFTHPASHAKINRAGELEKSIPIINPLGEENSVMRTGLLHSSLEVLALNYKHRNADVKIYEIGTVYRARELPLTGLPQEAELLSLGTFGQGDFFDLKGTVEELFFTLGVTDYAFKANTQGDTFHPGKAADIYIAGSPAGIIGEVHPDVAERYEIRTPVYMAELELGKLLKAVSRLRRYSQLNRFPSVTRDIALLVDQEVPAAQIEEVIRKYSGKSLEELKLFDVYQGKQVPEGKKSMAYAASFRAADRTLNESDISKIMEKLLKMLERELGAQLR